MDVLPPRWADVTDDVTELLDMVARKGQALDQLHQKHVLPAFNDDEAKRKEEDEIESLTQDITRAFHDCHRAIKRVEAVVRDSKRAGTLDPAEETMARNIQISLAARVQEASALFRKRQSAYLKKLKTLGGFDSAADRTSTPVQTNFNPDTSLLESDADRSFSQSTIQQQQQLHRTSSSVNDSLIQQREREIEGIAQGIIELADLFRDLNTMVIDQGTLLDRIDYNIERTAIDVRGAERELVVAEGYQRKSMKRKVIFLLILCIVGVVILLGIRGGRRGGGGGDGTVGEVSAPPPAEQDAPLRVESPGGRLPG
jgi:syntaxin 16